MRFFPRTLFGSSAEGTLEEVVVDPFRRRKVEGADLRGVTALKPPRNLRAGIG